MARSRSPIQKLLQCFETSPWPVYALDGARRIVFANAAMEARLALGGASIVGTVLPDAIAEDGNRDLTVLCGIVPPPSLGRQPGARTYRVVFPDGQTACALGIVLPGETGESSSVVLAVVVPDDVARTWKGGTPPVPSEASELHAQLLQLVRAEPANLPVCLLGTSPGIQRVRRQLQSVDPRSASLLIVGPPGIGREAVARWTWAVSGKQADRTAGLFPVACPLMDGELIAATLEAFDDHREHEPGCGLLLMEADRLRRDAQDALLFYLEASAQEGRHLVVFSTARDDLRNIPDYHAGLAEWLATWHVVLPALAARREDIPLMVQRLVEKLAQAHREGGGKPIEGVAESAMDQLVEYDWPENVAELSEVVSAVVAAATGPEITARDLPSLLRLGADAETFITPEAGLPIGLDDLLEQIERDLVARAMEAARGNKAHAARLLGISRNRVIRRVQEWGWDVGVRKPAREDEDGSG